MDNKIFTKAIAWAEKKGFKKIKAKTEDFESPSGMTQTGQATAVVPDITGFRRGRKSYIEIATKEVENKQALISKWKLFSILAERKGGKLYLLAARGNKAFTERIVNDYNLHNATVVSI